MGSTTSAAPKSFDDRLANAVEECRGFWVRDTPKSDDHEATIVNLSTDLLLSYSITLTIAIVGDPGSGKSTLHEHIGRQRQLYLDGTGTVARVNVIDCMNVFYSNSFHSVAADAIMFCVDLSDPDLDIKRICRMVVLVKTRRVVTRMRDGRCVAFTLVLNRCECRVVLVGTKCDLQELEEEDVVDRNESMIKRVCNAGKADYLSVSCVTGYNIQEIFVYACELALVKRLSHERSVCKLICKKNEKQDH